MNRSKWILVWLGVGLLCFTSTFVLADEEQEKPKAEKVKKEDVKKLSGKNLYKKHCKSCHMADSPNGEYTPMTLIQ